MKILVAIKRVPDYQQALKLLPDGSAIDPAGVKWIVNPFDEIAVEEAVRLKEAGVASEVQVVTAGSPDAEDQLRYALAMGADQASLVDYAGTLDSEVAATILSRVFRRGDFGLVVLGKQSIDSDANQTAQLLAGKLSLPQACFTSRLVIADDKKYCLATREVDGGLETVRLPLPAVISTDLRLNQPRYASLPAIMRARKKSITRLSCAELGLNAPLQAAVEVLKLKPCEPRKPGRRVRDVDELIAALRAESTIFTQG